jgi:hypothetical protein
MTVLGGFWRAARKVRLSYRVRLVYDDGTEASRVVRFPRPGWFVTTAVLFIPAGSRVRLPDGTVAAVADGEPRGGCQCDYGADPCGNEPAPGLGRCAACLAVCLPLSQGRSPYEPGG